MITNSKGRARTERVTGDALLYFILHNLISVAFFFFFTIRGQIYEGKNITLGNMISLYFWKDVVFRVLLFSIVSCIIGRISAFLIMRLYFLYGTKKSFKRWSEINRGLNNFILSVFLITSLMSSLIYSMGIILILQYRIFNRDTLLTLMATYILVKTGMYFFVRWILRAKI